VRRPPLPPGDLPDPGDLASRNLDFISRASWGQIARLRIVESTLKIATIRTRSLCAYLLALSLSSGTAAALEAPDLSGNYRMEGKGFGPNDSAYRDTCKLVLRGAVYAVSCYNENTRHTYVGKDLASGETLSVFIGDELKGDHNSIFTGEYLVVYRRSDDGSLTGTWVYAKGPAAGSETLTPLR
jgi:hypothetical protein